MARPRLLTLLFGLNAPVDRRTYLVVGFALMALKYAIDTALIYHFTRVVWTPLDYLSPALTTRQVFAAEAEWLVWTLGVITLPFLWVGLTMSVRRAVDAGHSASAGLLFLFPGLNYLVMLYLAAQPSAPTPPHEAAEPLVDSRLRAAVLGTGAGALVGLAMGAFAGLVLGAYGVTLFAVTPAVMGALSAWFYNRAAPQTLGSTLGVAALTVVIAGGAMLLFAVEGVVCLVMASPLAAVMALMGAIVGRAVACKPGGQQRLQVLIVVLALPLTAGFEATQPTGEALREVATSVEIDAPPEAVWPHVIGFSELPLPNELIFRAGIAYPMRARIEGEGVGAVRHCEFSTGAFVEPITHWAPPSRLSFDVIAQPTPMTETRPYRHLHPPHLDGYFRSRRGEFRLVPLPGGRTRLEGSTWYALDLLPVAYWSAWSDALVHGIHQRVLAHIKALAEAG